MSTAILDTPTATATLHLTQILVSYEDAVRLLRIRDTYDWHQRVWQAFDGRDGAPRDFLKDHLAKLSAEERRKVVDAFIRATLLAVPGARKNSMNAHTLPGYVLGTFKAAGQPVQLINAFENPVRPKSGLLDASIEALKAHHAKLKETWGIACDTEVSIPDINLNAFCEALTKHVS